MSFLEISWFLVAFLITAIVLVVDPKNSSGSSGSNPILGGFSSPSSEQKFIYRVSSVLIGSFFILTTILSFANG